MRNLLVVLTLAMAFGVSAAIAQSPPQSMGGSMGTTPRVRAGSATVQGSLSREVIRRVIRRNNPQLRYCYEVALSRTPDVAGRVTLRFIVAGNGSVQAATAADADPGMEEVAACIARQARRWQFPEPAGGGIVIVNYPFHFRPR